MSATRDLSIILPLLDDLLEELNGCTNSAHGSGPGLSQWCDHARHPSVPGLHALAQEIRSRPATRDVSEALAGDPPQRKEG